MAKYQEQTRYGITDLSDMELSVLTAGLATLATVGEPGATRYSEYKQRATELLRLVSPSTLQAIESRRREAQDAQAR